MNNTDGIHNITQDNLEQFFGSEKFYRHPMFHNWVYTQGIQFLAQNGALWLVTAILSHVAKYKKDFVVCRLKVSADKTCVLSFDEGYDDGKILGKQNISYTDFPLPEMTIYAENNTMMLPSER
jgi:hypothetical protein